MRSVLSDPPETISSGSDQSQHKTFPSCPFRSNSGAFGLKQQ